MSEILEPSKNVQNKIVNLLKEDFYRLRTVYQDELKNKKTKPKSLGKKFQRLYQKIEAVITINSLDPETKGALLTLQQEVKNFTQ